MLTRRPRSVLGLVAVVACAAGAIGALGALLRRRFYRVAVAERSMHPAIEAGDYLVVRRGPPEIGAQAFGRIVVFRDPDGLLLLKRVVGLPGEALRVGTTVQVNGRVLLEPYAHGVSPPPLARGLNRLSAHEYFLLGDRRDISTDSRHFGAVPRDRIEGVVVARYWPPRRVGRFGRPRRELVGRERPEGGPPEGIVGAGRALTAARRGSGAEPSAEGPRDGAGTPDSTGAQRGGSGEA